MAPIVAHFAMCLVNDLVALSFVGYNNILKGPLLMRKLGSGALDHLLCNVSLGCGSNTCISSILLLHFPLFGMEMELHHRFETAFLSTKLR